jgi:tetratricopeptide (TPR) repeat protein
MGNQHLKNLFALLAMCAAVQTFAAEAPPATGVDQLANQARYWESKARYDLSRDAWDKLLRLSPKNPSALAGLALAEARSGRTAASQMRLDQLKEVAPDFPNIRKIEEAIRQGSYDQDRLASPRLLSRQKKYGEAVSAYRQVFGASIPGGRLGLEFYQVMAGMQTPESWQEARRGLEKLAQENADDPQFQLAYAQHLTYQESARRQGLSILVDLSKNNVVAAPAKQAWRQALIWLAYRSGDEKFFREYLSRYGNDPQLSAKLAGKPLPNTPSAGKEDPETVATPASLPAVKPAPVSAPAMVSTYKPVNRSTSASSASSVSPVSRPPVVTPAAAPIPLLPLKAEAPVRRKKPVVNPDPVEEGMDLPVPTSRKGIEPLRLRPPASFDLPVAAPEPAPVTAPAVVDTRGPMIKQGFDSLNSNKLDDAAAAFQDVLAQYPDDDNALGGLGIVRLRQEDFAGAKEALERAMVLNPKKADRWREALATSRFWEVVRLAGAARKNGDNDTAEAELRRAIALDPVRAAMEPSVPGSLADVLVEKQQYAEAEYLYREVLRRHPGNPDVSRGLIGLLARGKRLADAVLLAEKMTPEQRAALGTYPILKAQYLREQAAQAAEKKDDARAEGLLKDALLIDPESPWTRLDLARVYQRQKRTRDANTLLEGLLVNNGANQSDAIFVKANMLAEQQQWNEALLLLERIPDADRSPGMYAFQRRLWVRYQTQRASIFARYGRAPEAMAILSECEPLVGDSPELLGALATAWADLGEEGRALRYIRQALTRSSGTDVGLRLQYGYLLFKLQQDTEFEVVMEDLMRQPSLSRQQSLDLANLRIAYRLRQADRLREEGDLARAYEYLQPLIKLNANDPRVLMALARLYNDSKDYRRTYDLYKRVLAGDNKNLDAYKGAIYAALSLEQWDEADALVNQALQIDPQNPRVISLSGRVARGRGDDARALELFQQALQLEAQRGGEAAAPYQGGNSAPQLNLLPADVQTYNPPLSLRAPPSATKLALQQGNSRFFKQRAGLARRPVVAKKAVVEGVKVAKSTKFAMLRPAKAHIALRYVSRGKSKARLWRVSERAQQLNVQKPTGTLLGESGYWQQDRVVNGNQGSFTFVEQESQTTRTVPAPRPQPARTFTPSVQQPIQPVQPTVRRQEFPVVRTERTARTAPSNPGLREEILRNIGDIRGRNAAQPLPVPGAVVEPVGEGYAQPYNPPARMEYSLSPQPVPQAQTVYSPSAVPNYGVPPPPVYTRPSAANPLPIAANSAENVPAPALQPAPARDPLLDPPDFFLNRQPVSQERRDLVRQINDIRAKRSAYVGGDLSVRNRAGVTGLDKLNDIETPIEAGMPVGDNGRVKLRLVPVMLDAGTVSGRQLPLFGAMALVNRPNLRFDQSVSGVALGAAYETDGLRFDVGSTPLGFPIQSMVGGINWQTKLDRVNLKFDIARRSVADSLLSYAGTRDPATGREWGGVTRTGGRLDLSYDIGKAGVYTNGAFYTLDGENVAANSQIEVGAGFYNRFWESKTSYITGGLNFTSFFYEKNLRRFTLGHGGYFSPQSFYSVAVPVEWSGAKGRFSYRLNAALAFQAFSEDNSALFPNDSDLQARAEAFAAANPTLNIATGYAGQQVRGVGFNFVGLFEYLLNPNLVVGGRLAIDNAPNYKEATASGFLRYLFFPQTRASVPPAPIYPNFNFGDPRL